MNKPTTLKSVTLITTCITSSEYDGDRPELVAITITPDMVKTIESYIKVMADMKSNGLNPSTISTHDTPRILFIAQGLEGMNPLNPDEYIQLMFASDNAECTFNEIFDEVANPDEYSTMDDLEYSERTECAKLKIRHDTLIWVDALEKYTGIMFESEGFGLTILDKIKEKLGMVEEVDTQKEFLENPCKCPHCKSDDVEGGSVQVDAGGAWQEVQCNECGATWNEVYKLVGFSELETK